FLVLEHVAEGVVRVHHVAAASVYHALGLSSAAAGVENEERVLGIHLLGGAVLFHLLQFVVQPQVAAFLHVHGPAQAVGDDHLLHAGAVLQGLVHHALHGDLLVAAVEAIAGEHHAALGVVHAVGNAAGA